MGSGRQRRARQQHPVAAFVGLRTAQFGLAVGDHDHGIWRGPAGDHDIAGWIDPHHVEPRHNRRGCRFCGPMDLPFGQPGRVRRLGQARARRSGSGLRRGLGGLPNRGPDGRALLERLDHPGDGPGEFLGRGRGAPRGFPGHRIGGPGEFLGRGSGGLGGFPGYGSGGAGGFIRRGSGGSGGIFRRGSGGPGIRAGVLARDLCRLVRRWRAGPWLVERGRLLTHRRCRRPNRHVATGSSGAVSLALTRWRVTEEGNAERGHDDRGPQGANESELVQCTPRPA